MNIDPGGEDTNAVFNDSVMDMLRTHCGSDAARQNPHRRGRKIIPGRPISNTPITTASMPVSNQPGCSSSHQPHTGSTGTSSKASAKEWICSECHEPWEGDNRWIVCDKCSKQYHLHCSGI